MGEGDALNSALTPIVKADLSAIFFRKSSGNELTKILYHTPQLPCTQRYSTFPFLHQRCNFLISEFGNKTHRLTVNYNSNKQKGEKRMLKEEELQSYKAKLVIPDEKKDI